MSTRAFKIEPKSKYNYLKNKYNIVSKSIIQSERREIKEDPKIYNDLKSEPHPYDLHDNDNTQ